MVCVDNSARRQGRRSVPFCASKRGYSIDPQIYHHSIQSDSNQIQDFSRRRNLFSDRTIGLDRQPLGIVHRSCQKKKSHYSQAKTSSVILCCVLAGNVNGPNQEKSEKHITARFVSTQKRREPRNRLGANRRIFQRGTADQLLREDQKMDAAQRQTAPVQHQRTGHLQIGVQ